MGFHEVRPPPGKLLESPHSLRAPPLAIGSPIIYRAPPEAVPPHTVFDQSYGTPQKNYPHSYRGSPKFVGFPNILVAPLRKAIRSPKSYGGAPLAAGLPWELRCPSLGETPPKSPRPHRVLGCPHCLGCPRSTGCFGVPQEHGVLGVHEVLGPPTLLGCLFCSSPALKPTGPRAGAAVGLFDFPPHSLKAGTESVRSPPGGPRLSLPPNSLSVPPQYPPVPSPTVPLHPWDPTPQMGAEEHPEGLGASPACGTSPTPQPSLALGS